MRDTNVFMCPVREACEGEILNENDTVPFVCPAGYVGPVLRLFPPCARISNAQGSSGVVDNIPLAWRSHTKSLTTRARPSPDLAVWLE